MLTNEELNSFEKNGFITLRNAFSSEVAANCMAIIWSEIEKQGVLKDDPSSWKKPVVRVNTPQGDPFVIAGRSPALLQAYDQLLGEGNWDTGQAVNGTIPVRFPSDKDPLDAGWHVDGSYPGEGGYCLNPYSRARGLLCLFLFSDVGDCDAPTRLLEGSHLDMPKILTTAGKTGMLFQNATGQLPKSTFERSVKRATGKAGDVFICHPFLVHAATWPHSGENPRAVAQSGVTIDSFKLANQGHEKPVERAILNGL